MTTMTRAWKTNAARQLMAAVQPLQPVRRLPAPIAA
jgi:hypothetical protein